MSGIHVLSGILKGGNKLENASPPEGKDGSANLENASAVFATLLSGFISPYIDTKGQNSKEGQDLEGMQSEGNPKQSVQSSNETSLLGYDNLGFLVHSLAIPQSDLPAGKEANSGESVSQGIENLSIATEVLTTNVSGVAVKDLKMALLNLVSLTSNESLASTGMTALNSQGDNHGTTELDKYRQVISNLLLALSGTIIDTTPEGNLLGIDSTKTKDLGQEFAKIVQGWMTETDEAGEEAGVLVPTSVGSSIGTKEVRQGLEKNVSGVMTTMDNVIESDVSSSRQTFQKLSEGLATTSVKSGNPELNTKVVNILATLSSILIEGDGGAKLPSGVNEILINEFKRIGIDLESIAKDSKDTAFLANVQQKSDGTGFLEGKNLKNIPGAFNEEVNNLDSRKSVEIVGTKDSQNQALSTGGVVANIVPVTLADGKIVTIPVWEQISTVLREQVMQNQQALKQLDIQLHPEDLGGIRVFLRWEGGQVHLQVNATEAATGQLLQNQLSELRQNLLSQGVNCGSLQMGQDGEGHQQSRGDDAQRMSRQSNTIPDEGEELVPIITHLSLGVNGINRINVIA